LLTLKLSLITLVLTLVNCTHSLAQHEVRVGYLLPLSGGMAFIGTDIVRGAELAVQSSEFSKVKIVPFYEDTVFDLSKTATAAKKLIHENKVNVLITLWDEADVVAPIAEKAGVLHISIRWDPFITRGHELTFTFESTFLTYVQNLLEMFKATEIKSMVFVGQDVKSANLVYDELTRTSSESGVKVVGRELFGGIETDFRSILLRATAKKPDVVFLFAFPPVLEILLKQIRQIAPKQRITGSFDTLENLAEIEGIPTVTPFGTSPDFDQLFISRYQEPFKLRAPHGFETTRIIKMVYSKLWKEKQPTGKEAAAELAKLEGWRTTIGTLKVSGVRNIEHPSHISVVKNRKREIITLEQVKALPW